jgi:dolichyl-phosphate beta-glucosyltransferase
VSVLLIVPCFNEAARWDDAYWSTIVRPGEIDVLFVDDGSTDATAECLSRMTTANGSRAIRLPTNAGKSEAVRQGLLTGWDEASGLIGFLDADGAFPAEDVARIVARAESLLSEPTDLDAVWTSRVLMAGRDIQRHTSRHYLGRALTTIVAPWHGYTVYDTQSGFKLFQRSATLKSCLQEPFSTHWFPDIELLMRWRRISASPMRVWEEPVNGWHDVAGSKMNRSQYRRVLQDLLHLYRSRTKASD